jgi:hypothetical protein
MSIKKRMEGVIYNAHIELKHIKPRFDEKQRGVHIEPYEGF